MGISTFPDLRSWFFAGVRNKGEGQSESAPHWNLYAGDYGAREVRIMSNTRISDMDESFAHLEQSIRAQNNPDGTRFRVQTYAPGKANNPTAETYVQIYERSQAPANAPQPAGIAGLPAGVNSIQEYVNERLKTERLQWELDALKEQMNAPGDVWERVIEHVSGIPGIDKVLQAVAIGLVSKFNPQAMPAIQTAMNGTPTAGSQQDDDDEADATGANPEQVFQTNIGVMCQTLGTDPVTLSKKLKDLVLKNPEMALQLMQTA